MAFAASGWDQAPEPPPPGMVANFEDLMGGRAPGGPGMIIEDRDPKTLLNQFCQKFCKRPVSKSDIIYEVLSFPGQGYQATVKLNCIEEHEFAGELARSPKEAEKNAAKQALETFSDQIAGLEAPTSKNKKKRKASGVSAASSVMLPAAFSGGMPPAGSSMMLPAPEASGSHDAFSGEPAAKVPRLEDPQASLTAKSNLNAACAKICKRPMAKNEITYETKQVALNGGVGFQSTVTCACLPEAWASLIWAGEAVSQKKDAEQSAAATVLQTLASEPELAAMMVAPPKAKMRRPPMGKGYGSFGGQRFSNGKGQVISLPGLGGMGGGQRHMPAAFSGQGFGGSGFGGGALGPGGLDGSGFGLETQMASLYASLGAQMGGGMGF